MKIYIDESGSFVNSNVAGSWNCVSGLCVPGSARRSVDKAVIALRGNHYVRAGTELKLRDIDENQYLDFLDSLSKTDVSLFSVAIDLGMETESSVESHRAQLVENLTNQIGGMLYDGGRLGLTNLRDQIATLPSQLYVQMHCQYQLIEDILRRSVLFYSQNSPNALKAFRWRIDQKNSNISAFEDAFLRTVPPMLQNRTMLEPIITLDGPYRNLLKEFEFKENNVPRWAISELEVPDNEALDVNKMIRKDLEFCDSKNVIGIQAVDLLASGTRRVLRGGFTRNEEIAISLGKIMLSNFTGQAVLRPISFKHGNTCSGVPARVLRLIDKNCRATIQP